MKSLTINLLALGTLALATNAHASGFKCTSGDTSQGSWAVKLFNKTVAETRIPAVMIVSNEQFGTVLTRRNDEISKSNRLNTVRYAVQGNDKVGAKQVILQIQFKEGRETLEAGEAVPGQLILVAEDGSRDVTSLSCERYLKGE